MSDTPANTPAEVGKNTGREYTVGYKKPPRSNQFGQPGATKKRGKRTDSEEKLKKLILEKFNEVIGVDKDGDPITRGEAMIVGMFAGTAREKEIILDRVFGKVKDEVQVNATIQEKPFDYTELISRIAPRPTSDNQTPGENEDNLDGQALGQNDYGGSDGD